MLPFTRRLFPTAHAVGTFTTAATRRNAKAFNHFSNLSEGEQNIYAKLTAKFTPSQLQVQDVSGGCGTFYAITISSSAFQGLSTLKQHKLVTDTLKLEIEGIHGLQIKTNTQ
ncbi:bola-like protein, partial [Phlegmacium glaucopus]